MQDSNEKKQQSYSQRIADKLKNIYGAHMQSSEKSNTNEEISMDEPMDKAAQADGADEVQLLKEQLKKAEAERDDFREHAVRKVAELENFRRRTAQEKEEMTLYANHKLLHSILPIIDDLQSLYTASRRPGMER